MYQDVFSGKIKYLTMTDTNKVWMPDTFFQVIFLNSQNTEYILLSVIECILCRMRNWDISTISSYPMSTLEFFLQVKSFIVSGKEYIS